MMYTSSLFTPPDDLCHRDDVGPYIPMHGVQHPPLFTPGDICTNALLTLQCSLLPPWLGWDVGGGAPHAPILLRLEDMKSFLRSDMPLEAHAPHKHLILRALPVPYIPSSVV